MNTVAYTPRFCQTCGKLITSSSSREMDLREDYGNSSTLSGDTFLSPFLRFQFMLLSLTCARNKGVSSQPLEIPG